MQMFGFKHEFREIKEAAKRSLHSLSNEYDIICIEGSGPARLFGFGIFSEIHEVGNMWTASIANAPILLVTDNLDSIVGTLSYIGEENQRVKGVLLNKFISDKFLGMGIKEKYIKIATARIKSVYSKKIGKDIIGVIPHFEELEKLPDLDPLLPGPKIDFNVFNNIITQIAESAREYIDINSIY